MPVMHEPHPRSNAADEPILFDGCPRCLEHAETLYDLDRSFILRLWWQMIAIETDTSGLATYRSHAEAQACQKLFTFYLLVERYGNLLPQHLFNPPVVIKDE